MKADGEEYARKHNVNEKKRYLFSGFIRCAKCGGSFVIGMHRKDTKIYACTFRKRDVCGNKVTLPQAALEARVREALDAIVKDPARLKELVAEHNRKLDERNDEKRAVVFGLEAEHARIKQEAARLVDAIAQGKGASGLIVEKIQRHEETLVELDARITDAQALLEPRYVPSAASKLAEYVTGDASIFRDDHPRDRALVERVLDKILVYPSGEIVLSFKRDSLFAPVMSLRTRADATSLRTEHRQIFDKLTANGDVRVWASEGPNGVCYATTRGRKLAADEPDCEWFELAKAAPGGGEIALATPTGQGRDFGADCERTLATPTGFEPVCRAPKAGVEGDRAIQVRFRGLETLRVASNFTGFARSHAVLLSCRPRLSRPIPAAPGLLANVWPTSRTSNRLGAARPRFPLDFRARFPNRARQRPAGRAVRARIAWPRPARPRRGRPQPPGAASCRSRSCRSGSCRVALVQLALVQLALVQLAFVQLAFVQLALVRLALVQLALVLALDQVASPQLDLVQHVRVRHLDETTLSRLPTSRACFALRHAPRIWACGRGRASAAA